jgi:hypothetical protein
MLRRGGSGYPAANRTRLARRGLAWTFCYPFLGLALCLATQNALSARYVDMTKPGGIRRIVLTPEPLAPLYWKVVAQTEKQYLMSSVFLPSKGKELSFRSYTRAEPELWQRLQREQPLFAVYADFVSFPVQRTEKREDGNTFVEYRDLRYEATLPALMKAVGRDDGLFLMQAVLGPGETLLQYRFLKRGKLTDTPWEKPLPHPDEGE